MMIISDKTIPKQAPPKPRIVGISHTQLSINMLEDTKRQKRREILTELAAGMGPDLLGWTVKTDAKPPIDTNQPMFVAVAPMEGMAVADTPLYDGPLEPHGIRLAETSKHPSVGSWASGLADKLRYPVAIIRKAHLTNKGGGLYEGVFTVTYPGAVNQMGTFKAAFNQGYIAGVLPDGKLIVDIEFESMIFIETPDALRVGGGTPYGRIELRSNYIVGNDKVPTENASTDVIAGQMSKITMTGNGMGHRSVSPIRFADVTDGTTNSEIEEDRTYWRPLGSGLGSLPFNILESGIWVLRRKAFAPYIRVKLKTLIRYTVTASTQEPPPVKGDGTDPCRALPFAEPSIAQKIIARTLTSSG